MRRVAWHAKRIRGGLDRRFVLSLAGGILVLVAIAALLITLVEKSWTFESFGTSVQLGRSTTVLGKGDSSYVTTAGGFVVGWLLVLFGVAIVGTFTGALVALVIDFLLKEGQGLGAAGYKNHIVVCGWNSTARELIQELRGDEYKAKVVVLADVEKNPAGEGVYFVRGNSTTARTSSGPE